MATYTDTAFDMGGHNFGNGIRDLAGNNTLDLPLPRISGYLTTVSYLLPRLGRALRPMLEK